MNIALKTLRVPATLTAVLATVMLAASVALGIGLRLSSNDKNWKVTCTKIITLATIFLIFVSSNSHADQACLRAINEQPSITDVDELFSKLEKIVFSPKQSILLKNTI